MFITTYTPGHLQKGDGEGNSHQENQFVIGEEIWFARASEARENEPPPMRQRRTFSGGKGTDFASQFAHPPRSILFAKTRCILREASSPFGPCVLPRGDVFVRRI